MDKHVITGFLVAPLLPCAVFAVAFFGFASNWSTFSAQLAVVVVIAELAAILLGVPIYLLLRRLRPIGLIECIGSGLFIGLLAGLAGEFIGATSGLIFWFIAVRAAYTGPNISSKRTREKPRAA